jgi:uncharacterized protein (DUF2235 family)
MAANGSGTANGSGPRRIVACCDGTWNSTDAGDAATNVVRIARVVKPVAADGRTQLVYYHPGIGTANRFDRIAGGCTGVGLSRNVRSVYAFIVNNWEPGDEVFLFGFSRGAYTARAVGGLIGRVGLLAKQDMGRFDEAWAWNRDRDRATSPLTSHDWYRNRRTEVPIQCVGVWDTVGALGIPDNRYLPKTRFCGSEYRFLDVELGAHVAHAFQALAIDERRPPFAPVLWTRKPGVADQTLKQVWFRGVHSDVGGGYLEHGAADLAFLWMAAMVDPLLGLDHDSVRRELERCQPWGTATLHNSYTLSWRLVGDPLQRAVAAGPDETVHASVPLRPGPQTFAPDRIEALTAFEEEFRWTDCVARGQPPDLPSPSVCDRLAHLLGGG